MRAPAILADDLTGALDTAAQFTGQWGPVSVWQGASPTPLTPPAAISSETRDLTALEAAGLSLVAARCLSGGVTFRKIDSLLRGPWAAELAALHQAGGFVRCVLAPAFPAQGRRTINGRQFVPGSEPIDIAEMLLREGLAPDGEGPVRIADAATDADLAALVVAETPQAPLWCGAAGLARAVAGVPPHRPAMTAGPVLAVVGSDHPVALAQIETVARHRPGAVVRLMSGDANSVGSAVSGAGDLTLVTFDLPDGASRAEAAATIADNLATLLPRLQPPSRLVVAGGATLGSVLQALGIRHLRCLGEVAPGLPVSRIAEGPWSGVDILSKSGAFGGPDTLLELCLPAHRTIRNE